MRPKRAACIRYRYTYRCARACTHSGFLLCDLAVAVLQIIGCQVRREPPNSTERYTRWINQLASDQLLTQVFFSPV